MQRRHCPYVRLIASFLALLAGVVCAQQDPFSEMQALLDSGFYASAAQINGPKLIENHPQNAEAHYLYSYALYLNGDLEGARAELDRALELGESLLEPRFDHLNGLLQAASGNYAEAEQLLQQAFMRSHSYTYAMDWGRVAWQQGNFETALRAYAAAATTEEGKSQPWPHLNRGRILSSQGRYQEAIEAFNTAITVFEEGDITAEGRPSPAYVEAFYRIGEIYEQLGDLDGAKSYFSSARNSDPTYSPAIIALDRINNKLRSMQEGM